MHSKFGHLQLATSGPQACPLKGSALLNTPFFNKGAAFPADERVEFKLTGLLPTNVSSLDVQAKRAYQQYSTRANNLAKNTFMTSLAEQNTVLYFRVSLEISIQFYDLYNLFYTTYGYNYSSHCGRDDLSRGTVQSPSPLRI